MGIYNRDYIRDSTPQPGSFRDPHANWAIKYLLIANIVVFLLQNGAASDFIVNWCSLNLQDVQNFQIWRLVTYGFCHAGFEHILFNMYVLWMFGRLVEPIYGSREFLAFYLAGVVISGLCHIGIQAVQGVPNGVIGASGGVMAVVFLCAMIYPRMTVLLMFIFPIEFRFLAILYAFIDLWGALNPQGSPVAHAAHLGGAAFGVAYKYFGWRILPFLRLDRWNFRGWKFPKRARKHPQIRAYRPPEEDFDSRVDRVLQKIQDQGESSLTNEERALLTEASKRYKSRN